MSLGIWGSRGSSGQSELEPTPADRSLDSSSSVSRSVVTRTFRITNLLLTRDPKEGNFLLDFELQRVGVGNFGTDQNSDQPPPLLRIKAEGKEIALFSGILDRELEIEETRWVDRSSVERLTTENSALRDRVAEQDRELTALRNYLMESQRPLRSA